MLNVILAVDQNFGLGKSGVLAWNIPEDLGIFKQKTMDSIVIVGRKTIEKLPILKDRMIYCISKEIKISSKNEIIYVFPNIESAIYQAKKLDKKIFIIGGNQVYDYVFKYFKHELKLHISFVNGSHDCDTYFDAKHLDSFYIENKINYTDFSHCEMKYIEYGERQYLNLIDDLCIKGYQKIGRNGDTISDFCKHLKFDLRDGFPLLTTKKMFTKGVIEELLFFIRGDTNTKILEEKGVNIWRGNTCREFLDANGFAERKEGEMGPMYGAQWRQFNSYICDSNEQSLQFNVDQLKNVINEIMTSTSSRRILLTTYNPSQVEQGVLYPCHSITIQFYVQDGFLDMFCYNRSSDIGLGLPFNIASSALFLMIISQLTKLKPRYFNLTLGDAHIYANHKDVLLEQIKRMPYAFPRIELPEFSTLKEVENLTHKDFKIINYNCYETIKMSMVA